MALEAITVENLLSLERLRSAEAREGMTAFGEKRDPQWVVS